VDSSVRLASGRGPVGAVGPVAGHVGLYARLSAAELVGTRLPASSGPATILPVGILDLVRAAAQRSNIHDATNVSVAVRFHLADALHTLIGELSRTRGALRCGSDVQVV